MKKISIKDVAKKAGVSISTVSRVLTNSAPVSEELREKVIQAVQELGYSPSSIARSLRNGATKTIGFILPDITNPFFANIVRGAEDYLRQHGYTLIFGSSDQDKNEENHILEALLSKHIDGLLFTGSGDSNPKLLRKIEQGLKVVFLDRIIRGVNSSYVIVDNKRGISLLVDHLLDDGHKSFLFINGDKNTFSAKQRYEAFLQRMKSGKYKYEHHFTSFSYEAGYKFASQLSNPVEFDAILCGNDLIAFGVIDALEDRGIRVPEQVSVTGFDDIPFSRHYKPALTTVRQPMYEMGQKACELLLKMIKEQLMTTEGIILEPELVVRESTKRRI
ncbi:MAG: LacI family DNA-binding transcriptional regulator [Fervidobacterium pennivorans]|uniref:LacI family transcriptional regulator n=1 Tax=Fervidobacterium islandicum TaxID=2423 RepID=A0AAI8GC73_FERIS|nr:MULTISPECIES: LacI family DNA-binding transcriptional regulator [Fervidobacterium]AMW32029.1 LacI family transcriptional regulator [Fervidobacterium islandicum]MDM7320759.1 LacI family DNA-binding transcriptional regulator [Fervidobacterium sp.]NPU88369.1 LacI family transcriptional regulator [Fervidobacterium sp.]